ncbi:MAG: enoyl-CoA hydratase-related protein [Lachnospiraceae bacterium]|nr:enoyl-CoA hydratase-related protein [Lachnospiraceae bacterium]
MNYVKYEQKNGIGTITIDRQKALNALNQEVLAELEQVVDGVDLDTTRCLILTGAGEKAFVAGADIGSQSTMTKEEGRQWCLYGNRIFRKLELLPVPVIAAVNGYALGGGSELALACDIRIASENAVFAQPEVGLGITAGFGGTQRLPRLIGIGKAKELLYTGDRVKADEALRLGLVNQVVPLSKLLETASVMANKIAGNAPIAVRASKKAIHAGLETDLDSGIRMESEQFSICYETNDQKNAMGAFLEKKKPDPFTNS